MPSVRRRVLSVIGGVVFVLVPWLSFGLATPFAFGAAALAMRSRLLALATVAYAAAWVTGFATIGSEDGTTGRSVFGWALAVVMFVGGMHALVLSPWLVRALRGRRVAPAPPAPPVDEAASQVAAQTRAEIASDPTLRRALRRRTRRALAREIVEHDPALAAELGIGRPELGRGFRDGGLVDVNAVPVRVLADLPGFDAAMAERVVAARERYGGVESGADLVVFAYVPQEVVDRLSDRLLFLPRSSLEIRSRGPEDASGH